jgi:hypothetical protein
MGTISEIQKRGVWPDIQHGYSHVHIKLGHALAGYNNTMYMYMYMYMYQRSS